MNYLAIVFLGFIATPLAAPTDQSKEIEHRARVKPSQRIEIRGLTGMTIDFKSWDKDEVYLKLNLHISSSDEEYEAEFIKSFEVEERTTDGNLLLTFREPTRNISSGFWSIFKGGSYVSKEIRGEIFVPSGNPLTTDMSYGTLSMSGVKGELNVLGKNNTLMLKGCSNLRRVTNDYGKTEVEDGGGSLDLTGTSSTVTVVQFAGPASVDANYSNIILKAVKGPVELKSQSGTHTVEDIDGNLTVHSRYSTITVSRVNGLLDVTSQSGSLKVRNVRGLVVSAPYSSVDAIDVTGIEGKDIRIANQSSSIDLENIRGKTIIDAPYCNIDLKNIDGSVEVETTSGTVNAQDITGDWRSRTSYSRLRLRGLRSKEVVVTNKSENVQVDLIVVPKSVEIRNEYGGVSVNLPKGFSGDISLDAEYGRVDTDFAVQTRNRGSSGYAVGKIGTGNGKIAIETRSGNIELHQK